MSFGPSQAELDAQAYNKQYQENLPKYLNQAQGYINTGISGLGGVNSKIDGWLSTLGNDPQRQQLSGYFNDVLSGKLTGPQASAATAQSTNLGMSGNTFASLFAANLGGLALQEKNMQTVADKLGSTSEDPFTVLTKKATEDAALQQSAGLSQLRSQLAAQGLDSTSGTGAAALAALQFNTNKSVADAARQNAV